MVATSKGKNISRQQMLAKGEDPCLYTKSAKLIYIIREREIYCGQQKHAHEGCDLVMESV